MRRSRDKTGFTLVELSLSIVFIAILSLTIVFIVNNAIAVYRRGLTLNQVNTVGMDLVDDFRVTIQNSPPVTLQKLCTDMEADCDTDEGQIAAMGLISRQRKTAVNNLGDGAVEIPIGGAFCTGAYSYVWNSGYFFSDNISFVNDNVEAITFTYKMSNGSDDSEEAVTMDNFRLLKIRDTGRTICKDFADGGVIDMSGEEASVFSSDDVMELLSAEDDSTGLALYDLYSPIPATNTIGKTSLYSVSFVLGTVQGGANINASGDFCKTPASHGGQEDFDYCAINKFNFAAQANGG